MTDELTHRLWWKLGDVLAQYRDRNLYRFPYDLAESVRELYPAPDDGMLGAFNRLFDSFDTVRRYVFYDRMESLYSEMGWELMGDV